MKKFVACSIISIIIFDTSQGQSHNGLKLWYNHPANASAVDDKSPWHDDSAWLNALPVGDGNIGAMVFGDVKKERIQLNEKTLWSGSPDDHDNQNAFDSLNNIRELLYAGKYQEAEALTKRTQICKGAGSAFGAGANVPFGCYQTLGDLWIDFERQGDYSNYHRELDLDKGIVSVYYEQDHIHFQREAFVDAGLNVLVIRLSANKKASVSFRCELTRPERFTSIASGDELIMSGSLTNGAGGMGMQYLARLKAVTKGGTQKFDGNNLVISKADEVTIYLTASTDYLPIYPSFKGRNFAAETDQALKLATGKGFDHLKLDHINNYRKYFSRVSLKLVPPSYLDSIPTDQRLSQFNIDHPDNYLTELYFQFGRYLLISSAGENSLPANLQGIWANKIQTAWNCDYHTNINVQMNYWPAEVTNLSELQNSLVKYVELLARAGSNTARIQYHARGWCVHTIANVWGFTAPGEDPSWGLSLGTGGWLCHNLWEHYQFTNDVVYLRRIYPVLKNAAGFYLDWLSKDRNTGKLVSGPASSPENHFIAPDGTRASISMGPTHDQEIIHELFSNVLTAANLLHDRDSIISQINSALENLLEPTIGDDGRLLEWAFPFKETEPGHRHLSHLYALYPGNQFTKTSNPGYVAAAKKSLEFRLANGGGYTGWSGAWVCNLWARLQDGNKALIAIDHVLGKNTAPNLFDLHPPFQIDGNLGITAGIAEMLVQSQDGFIDLLPALPDAWVDGEVKGLCARGGFVVDIKWREGKLVNATFHANSSSQVKIKYKEKGWKFSMTKDKSINLIYPGSKKR